MLTDLNGREVNTVLLSTVVVGTYHKNNVYSTINISVDKFPVY